VVSATPRAPVNGKRIIGRRAVTAMGITSRIHQVAIQSVEARTATPFGAKPSGLKKK
jgi:hypothetical protein